MFRYTYAGIRITKIMKKEDRHMSRVMITSTTP